MFCMSFDFFFAFFVSVSRLAFFCTFFAFWPAAASRLAFFLHFGRPWDLDVPPFRILPGLGRFSPKKCTKKAKRNSSRPATQKKAKQNSSRPAKHEKNANSKCKKNAKQKKKCKQQMQKKANYIVCIGVDNVLGWTRRSPLRFF